MRDQGRAVTVGQYTKKAARPVFRTGRGAIGVVLRDPGSGAHADLHPPRPGRVMIGVMMDGKEGSHDPKVERGRTWVNGERWGWGLGG